MVSGAVAIETRLQGGQPIEGAASGLVGLRAHEDHTRRSLSLMALGLNTEFSCASETGWPLI